MACDRTSVGIIAQDSQGRVLMLRRNRYPYGYAPPSGHCDGRDYPVACHVQFEKKTGLKIVGAPKPLALIKNSRLALPFGDCLSGSDYHFCQVFEVEWSGLLDLIPGQAEWIGWKDRDELRALAQAAMNYRDRLKLAEKAEDENLVRAIKESIERDWKKCPGLAVVWLDIFIELKII